MIAIRESLVKALLSSLDLYAASDVINHQNLASPHSFQLHLQKQRSEIALLAPNFQCRVHSDTSDNHSSPTYKLQSFFRLSDLS